MGTENEQERGRIIAHLDMDAFFAAVEERNNPYLQGKPVVVGADPADGNGRGVVSTANYAAREYGIHSALPISQAWRLSQRAKQRGQAEAVFVRGSFGVYSEVSRNIMNIIGLLVRDIQQVGVDEAYFDVSFTGSYGAAAKLCRAIKLAIFTQEKLTASVGLGPNKLVAKIASDFEKPDGLTVVPDGEKEAFLGLLPVRKIPGVGPKTEMRLRNMGVSTVADVRKFSEAYLCEAFGKWGAALYRKARGADNSPLREERAAKSMGRQTTFRYDTRSFAEVMAAFKDISGETVRRLKTEGFRGARTVAVTVRLADFTTLTRSYTPPGIIKTRRETMQHAARLLLPFFDARENPRRQAIRLVGVRLEHLE